MLFALLGCAADLVSTNPPSPDTASGGGDSAPEVIGEGACDPGASPVFVDEGEAVQVVVRCLGDGTATSFDVTELPPGATFSGDTLSWTPGLADAGHYALTVTSVGDEPDVGQLEIWVADAWYAPENTPVNPVNYPEEHGLPVMHLEVPAETNDNDDVATTMVYRGRPWALEIKYRGAASSYYPKRSFTLSFGRDEEFEDEDEGFDKRRKATLTTLFDDNSYLRQLLCYELWSAMDDERHDIQAFLTVVYVNGAYEGLYLLTDHIDGEYWEDHGYDEFGSLYKSVTHQGNFYADYNGAPKATWHDGYEKQEGDEADWSDIDALVQFVAQSDDASFDAGIADRVVIEEIADWWILVRFTEADDSGGKNAYLYVDPDTGVVHHAPWDFNHSFGQTWQTERQAASTDYDFFWSNNLFRRLLASPEWGPVLQARMREQLATTYDARAVDARIDGWLERAEPSAERDWVKWANAYQTYGGWYWRTDWTSHDEEVAYLRAWVAERAAWFADWYPAE